MASASADRTPARPSPRSTDFAVSTVNPLERQVRVKHDRRANDAMDERRLDVIDGWLSPRMGNRHKVFRTVAG